jgi:hypothetical protein
MPIVLCEPRMTAGDAGDQAWPASRAQVNMTDQLVVVYRVPASPRRTRREKKFFPLKAS